MTAHPAQNARTDQNRNADTHTDPQIAARQKWMAVLARTSRARLETLSLIHI